MKLGKMNDKIDDLDDEIDRKDSLKKASIKFLGDLEIIQQIKNQRLFLAQPKFIFVFYFNKIDCDSSN